MIERSRTNLYIVVIMGVMLLFVFYLQKSIAESTDAIKSLEVEKAKSFAVRIKRYVQTEAGDHELIAFLDAHPEKRKEINTVLHAFLTQELKYIFMLVKDAKGHYRFLLDASIDEPMEYRSVFFPKNKRLFDEVYRTGEMKIVRAKDGVEDVWLSVLYPVTKNGKTQMLMVIDLSKTYSDNLSAMNDPLITIVKLMQLFLIFSIFFMAYVMYSLKRLRQRFLYDPLTSVYSKYYLSEFFRIHSLKEYDMIMLDIDEFRSVNARFGYDAGDQVLLHFAQTVREFLPESAVIVRNGGAAFLIVVKKGSVDLKPLAESLFKYLRQKRYLAGNEVVMLTVSMSVLDMPKDIYTIQQAERILDERMLEVKNSGKDTILFVGNHMEDYYTLDQIREILEREELVCLYQPVVDTHTQKTVRFEALVRLIDPQHSDRLIIPAQFMHVIKGTSQYLKMSKLVLKQVFKTLKQYPKIYVSINLDLHDLYNQEVIRMILDQIRENRMLAYRLSFEILEDHEIEDYEKVRYIFTKLRMYGSKIAIDDFGSGYANYRYLLHLDIDTIKVDGQLVQALKEEPERTETLLNSIRLLASEFGCELVAEFVSDEEIYHHIKHIGFDLSQGYYFGKPLPIEYYLK